MFLTAAPEGSPPHPRLPASYRINGGPGGIAAAARGDPHHRSRLGLRELPAAGLLEPFRDRESAARRRAAIDVLRPLGLADVITGGQSGVILDANMGVLEPVPDVAQRAALDRTYEAERSERLAEEGRAIVNRARVQLQERLRARGLDRRESPRTARPDDAARRQYERACREIGAEPVSYPVTTPDRMAYAAQCEREAAGKAYQPEPATETRTHQDEIRASHQSAGRGVTPASGEGHGPWPRQPI